MRRSDTPTGMRKVLDRGDSGVQLVAMILLAGASGQLGRRVARRLCDAGMPVRALTREPSRLAHLAAHGAHVVEGDLVDGAWIPAALDGVEAVVIASHGLAPPSRRNHPGVVDGAGTARLVDALASLPEPPHVVFTSVIGVEFATSAFGRLKLATEQRVRDAGLPFTFVRPTVFIETHVLFLLGEALRTEGRVNLFGSGAVPLNFVSAEDVADEVVAALGNPALRGAVRTVGGPDVMSRLDALAVVEEALQMRAKRRHLPVPALRGLRALTRFTHRGLFYLTDMGIAEETRGETLRPDATQLARVGTRTVRHVVEGWAASVRAPAA
jgi:uncharacterized protein YbjT (DUF2867 family)